MDGWVGAIEGVFFFGKNVRFRETWSPELCTAMFRNLFLDTGDGSGGIFFGVRWREDWRG